MPRLLMGAQSKQERKQKEPCIEPQRNQPKTLSTKKKIKCQKKVKKKNTIEDEVVQMLLELFLLAWWSQNKEEEDARWVRLRDYSSGDLRRWGRGRGITGIAVGLSYGIDVERVAARGQAVKGKDMAPAWVIERCRSAAGFGVHILFIF